MALLAGCDSNDAAATLSGRFDGGNGCAALDGIPVFSRAIARYEAGAVALSFDRGGARIRYGTDITAVGERLGLEQAQQQTGHLLDGECFAAAPEVVVIEKFVTGCDPSCHGT